MSHMKNNVLLPIKMLSMDYMEDISLNYNFEYDCNEKHGFISQHYVLKNEETLIMAALY